MAIFICLVTSVDDSVSNIIIDKPFFLDLYKVLIIIVLGILRLPLNALINGYLFFDILFDVFKSSPIFSTEISFRFWLSRKCYEVAINIILVLAFSIIDTKTEGTLGCGQYLGEKKIESSIIWSKIPCFLIYE